MARDEKQRPNVNFTAPVGCVDLATFDENDDPYTITPCPFCLPWHAEVVRNQATGEILVREWHAVECEHFQELIDEP